MTTIIWSRWRSASPARRCAYSSPASGSWMEQGPTMTSRRSSRPSRIDATACRPPRTTSAWWLSKGSLWASSRRRDEGPDVGDPPVVGQVLRFHGSHSFLPADRSRMTGSPRRGAKQKAEAEASALEPVLDEMRGQCVGALRGSSRAGSSNHQ